MNNIDKRVEEFEAKAKERGLHLGYKNKLSEMSDWLRQALEQTAQEERERILGLIKKRQKGWLGKQEDGSDRHEFYDELQIVLQSLSQDKV